MLAIGQYATNNHTNSREITRRLKLHGSRGSLTHHENSIVPRSAPGLPPPPPGLPPIYEVLNLICSLLIFVHRASLTMSNTNISTHRHTCFSAVFYTNYDSQATQPRAEPPCRISRKGQVVRCVNLQRPSRRTRPSSALSSATWSTPLPCAISWMPACTRTTRCRSFTSRCTTASRPLSTSVLFAGAACRSAVTVSPPKGSAAAKRQKRRSRFINAWLLSAREV